MFPCAERVFHAGFTEFFFCQFYRVVLGVGKEVLGRGGRVYFAGRWPKIVADESEWMELTWTMNGRNKTKRRRRRRRSRWRHRRRRLRRFPWNNKKTKHFSFPSFDLVVANNFFSSHRWIRSFFDSQLLLDNWIHSKFQCYFVPLAKDFFEFYFFNEKRRLIKKKDRIEGNQN